MTPQQDEQLDFEYPELAFFILRELSAMADSIVTNYANNMENRENNPFLRFNDSNMKKYMALGRSIDSQLGNRLQRIILFIARVRYGILHVPNIVTVDVIDDEARNIVCKLYSVPFDTPDSAQNRGFDPYRQFVYVGCNKSDRNIKQILKVKAHADVLQIASRTFNGISENALQHIRSNVGKRIPVDLLFLIVMTIH